MKKNKIMFLVLVVALIITTVGCNTDKMQTRLNNNDRNSGLLNNDTNRLNTNLNNGMSRRNMDLNNDTWDNNNLNDPMLRNNTNMDSGALDNNNFNNNMGMNNTNNMSNRANDIAKRVAALSEVNSASVVIHGNTAIVGIAGNKSNMKDNNISSSLKKKIEAAVKAGDKDIKDIKITSDSDITNRLKTMTTNLNKGNPISEFTKDIEDILKSITNPMR